MRKFLISFFILLLFATYSFGAESANPANQNQDKDNAQKSTVTNKAMKVFLDKIEVYGRIAKPQTVFIIPGSDPRVNGIRIERRFFSDMFRKVEKSTLRKEKIKDLRNNDHLLW
ncbi:hypothetical protein GF337_08140 [candidate division KSB1 bacterium]|nr:hypothetical protein [candidate division KSB1 bacterium]